ncbi:MAG TPA: DUF1345 domain-containing protein [Micromonosporaceae bacterium]|nr:DUF1345 domain-containing protein [Micromonosporaceae bacterium]
MTESAAPMRPRNLAVTHLVGATVPGVVVAVVVAFFVPIDVALLIGWDVAAAVFLAGTWLTVHGLDGPATKVQAVRDDPTRTASDLTVLIASAASLAAVATLIIRASNAHGAGRVWDAALGVGSVVMAWLVVHATYMLRYATIYHTGGEGGVDFNQTSPPRYTDFAYLAFTIGMTFQVSDTTLTSSEMRANALRHALLSYLYGTVIIAATINLIAGLNR